MLSFFKKKGPKVYPVRMVVGLGNPGAQYARTRHNVGFEALDELAQKNRLRISHSRKQALVLEAEIEGVAVALVKPLTFMNLSGRAVKALADEYSLRPDQILVIADDLDLPVGRVKMKPGGSAGGHNGHKSIIGSLKSDAYPRVKIGIGKSGETIDHVLGRFDPEERADIDRAINRAVEGIELWLNNGIDAAMNRINSGG